MSTWRWGHWDETLVLTWPEFRSVMLAVVIIGTIAIVRYLLPGDWFHDGPDRDGGPQKASGPLGDDGAGKVEANQTDESQSLREKIAK